MSIEIIIEITTYTNTEVKCDYYLLHYSSTCELILIYLIL